MAKSNIQKKELKPCHFRAVATLVATGNVSAAARVADVSERTLRRWMAMPAFKVELRDAETDLVMSATRRLGRLTDKALGVLESVMDDSKAADNPRICAAATVLDTCLRWRDQVVLEGRISALEEQLRGGTS